VELKTKEQRVDAEQTCCEIKRNETKQHDEFVDLKLASPN